MSTGNETTNREAKSENQASVVGLLLRLFWMFLGNIALGVSAMMILGNRDTIFGIADIAYALAIPLTVAARYVDIAHYGGVTAYGEPATMADWKRHTAVFVPAAILIWAACHAASYALGK